MAQFARPSSDVQFGILGATPTDTAGNRYTNVDESTPDSSDYVYSQNNPNGSSSVTFGLSSITDPGVDTGHILRVGHFQIDEDSGSHPMGANTGGTATNLAWELRQNGTGIASGSLSPSTIQVEAINLSSTDIANITDYSQLQVDLNPSGGAGPPANRRGVAIYFVELEAPDAQTEFPRTASDTTSTSETPSRLLGAGRAASDTVSGSESVFSEKRGPAQDAFPVSDVEVDSWVGEDQRTTGLFSSISDESDATYILSPQDPTSASLAEFSLETTVDPEIDSGHVLFYRYSGHGTVTLVVELVEGTTVLDSWSHVDPPTTPTDATHNLDAGVVASITDYSNLRIRFRGA